MESDKTFVQQRKKGNNRRAFGKKDQQFPKPSVEQSAVEQSSKAVTVTSTEMTETSAIGKLRESVAADTNFSMKFKASEFAKRLLQIGADRCAAFSIEVDEQMFESLSSVSTVAKQAQQGIAGMSAWVMPLQMLMVCKKPGFISEMIHVIIRDNHPQNAVIVCAMPYQSTPFTHTPRRNFTKYLLQRSTDTMNTFKSSASQALKIWDSVCSKLTELSIVLKAENGTVFSDQAKSAYVQLEHALKRLNEEEESGVKGIMKTYSEISAEITEKLEPMTMTMMKKNEETAAIASHRSGFIQKRQKILDAHQKKVQDLERLNNIAKDVMAQLMNLAQPTDEAATAMNKAIRILLKSFFIEDWFETPGSAVVTFDIDEKENEALGTMLTGRTKDLSNIYNVLAGKGAGSAELQQSVRQILTLIDSMRCQVQPIKDWIEIQSLKKPLAIDDLIAKDLTEYVDMLDDFLIAEKYQPITGAMIKSAMTSNLMWYSDSGSKLINAKVICDVFGLPVQTVMEDIESRTLPIVAQIARATLKTGDNMDEQTRAKLRSVTTSNALALKAVIKKSVVAATDDEKKKILSLKPTAAGNMSKALQGLIALKRKNMEPKVETVKVDVDGEQVTYGDLTFKCQGDNNAGKVYDALNDGSQIKIPIKFTKVGKVYTQDDSATKPVVFTGSLAVLNPTA